MRLKALTLTSALLLSSAFAFASGGGGTGGATCACVSLAVSKEVAPAGTLAQLKVSITEPKPISTGGGSFTFTAFDSLFGISLSSHSRDGYGVAVVNGNQMKLSVISPAATLASAVDYPILTVVGRVPPGTPAGTKFPLDIDAAALQLYDTSGVQYPVDVKPGHLVAGNSVTIGDVSPGSALLRAGDTVTITGGNFVPGTKIKFAEAKIDATRFVDANHIVVTLGSSADMHGMMIKASNPDGTQSTYFSYQRTLAAAPLSSDPVLQHAVPLMPPVAVKSATVSFPAAAPGITYGIALQNITADTTALVEQLDDAGTTVAAATVFVPRNRFAVRELGELFGLAPLAATMIRVTSDAPIEVLGVAADQTTGTARPIIAQ